MRKIVVVLVFFVALVGLSLVVRADNCDLQCQIDRVGNDLKKLNDDLKSQTTGYQSMLKQIEDIKSRIVLLGEEIKKSEEALIYQKQLLNVRVKSYYKNITGSSLSLVDLLLSQNLSESLNKFFYQKTAVDEDKKTIIKVVLYVKNLEDQKARLAVLKEEVDQQSKALAGQIVKTKQKIAQLSAQQQQLIAQKLASLNISRSAASMGRCDSDLTNGRDPGFSPKFALFTYGVPNRVGLNQYGAKGRAAFQGHEDILRAYFNDINFETRSNINIKVQGYGEMSLETYLLGIYEMPEDWPMEALKAQVIAARSYALAYTNNGAGEICTTESCQVYHQPEKTGPWKTAVQETAGKVMVQGGNPIKAWYSSTHGGYVFSSGEIGWSSTSWTKHANDFGGGVGSFSDLKDKAYDKESPWFYCDWGSRDQYNKTAWLKPEEVADIVNVILLARSDASTTEHLYQPDKPNPAGTDTWDAEKVKSELRSRGGSPYNAVSDISVSADFGSGRSTSVTVSGDGSSPSLDAGEFKNWFNLRAPAKIQIVGPLYNAEKR